MKPIFMNRDVTTMPSHVALIIRAMPVGTLIRFRSAERRLLRAVRFRLALQNPPTVKTLDRFKTTVALVPVLHRIMRRYVAGVDHPDLMTRVAWKAMGKLQLHEVMALDRRMPDPLARRRGRPKGTGHQSVDLAVMPMIARRIAAGELLSDICKEVAAAGHPGASRHQASRRLQDFFRVWSSNGSGPPNNSI